MTDNLTVCVRLRKKSGYVNPLKMDDNSASEQLEEGEIVDDDDFEDISDNSIIDSAFGKFVTSNENLRALSLSSGSESDVIRIRYKRKLLHRKSKIKHQRRRKRLRLSSDTSDTDNSPSHDLKGKLKEAIRINEIEEKQKNTLKARLKAMGATTDPPLVAAEPPPETHKETEDNSEKLDDMELENLRMEALKTAVLNKCQRRKRKKALLEGQDTVVTLENKENDTPKEPNDKSDAPVTNPIVDFEEDEDVLRASLLANLAKKITKKTAPIENLMPVKPTPPRLPIKVVSALPKRPITKFKSNIVNKQIINKRVINNKIQKINRPKPQVKPLIINVNDDSDTEEEPKQNLPVVTNPPTPDLKAITSNVEKFLKEQRAKFETENKKKFQVINTTNKDKSILEKSAVKLLPKSQQIEYQQLLKRLRSAEKKKKAKKLALEKRNVLAQPQLTVEVCQKVLSEASVDIVAPAEIALIIQPDKKSEEASKSDSSCGGSHAKSSKESDTSERRRSRITNELTTLQRTLKEIKMHRNGSLQIKSKYQVLTPIIRKITTISNDRKKQEIRIKTLLQELKEARNNLAKSHEKFSSLVRELVSKKEKIDKSSQEPKSDERKKENGKITKKATNGNKIENRNVKAIKSLPVTSTPIKSQSDLTDPAFSTFVTSSTNNDCEDMDVCNSDETDICQIDIVDPNDIDQIFKRRPPVKSTIPEYVSPLNYNSCERYRNVDPLGIMCPYEVNGSCRDIDCTYKHYLKSHERL